jgi:hypothetical protein
MFSWTLRIAGWIIGIYALLKLAKATGAVTYTQVFQAWLDQLRDILDLGFILKPLTQAVILPALDLIRSFDIPIPPLQDHWQQLFVLTWLLSGSVARNMFGGTSAGARQFSALVGNLPFAVASGTLPLLSGAVSAWLFAGVFAACSALFVTCLFGSSPNFRLRVRTYLPRASYALMACVALVALGLISTSVGSIKYDLWLPSVIFLAIGLGWLVGDLVFASKAQRNVAILALLGVYFLCHMSLVLNFGTPQPAQLLVVLALVSSLGVWLMLIGAYFEGVEKFRGREVFLTGLDITAAMLGAFGLATAFADPPLF